MEITSDLKKIAELDNQKFQALVKAYADTTTDGIERTLVLKKLINEDEKSESLVRFLSFVTDDLAKSRDYSSAFEELDTTFEKLTDDDSVARRGWEAVKSIESELDGFLVQSKAKDLRNRYARITDFQITTDVRPVFSMERKEVREALYPFILKIETVSGDSLICEFYEDYIDEIESELKLAKEKMELIKNRYGKD